jgi:uncharacterized protein (DUF2267 family)
MQMERFLSAVQKHSGSSEEVARRASIDALEVFGQLLLKTDQKAVADELPDELADAIRRHQPGRTFGVEELYDRIEVKHDASKSFQIEHAQAVLEALGRLIDKETRRRIVKHLPEEIGELVTPRDIKEVHGPEHHVTEESGRKMSTGKPGSSHPLSEGTSDAHSNSVANADNPHGARKLSTGRQSPNEGHDLATGRPDGKFVPPEEEQEE